MQTARRMVMAHAMAFGALVALGASAPEPGATGQPGLHLIPGEVLTYAGDFGVFGQVGRGEMKVSGPECLRDRPVYRIDFGFEGRVMLMRIRDRTTSWVDAEHGITLRYHKEERHPVGSRVEEVEIHPELDRWEGAGGEGGPLGGRAPLD